jgi:hypothetical protein
LFFLSEALDRIGDGPYFIGWIRFPHLSDEAVSHAGHSGDVAGLLAESPRVKRER